MGRCNKVLTQEKMKEIELAKWVITEEVKKASLKVVKIILFGSRARDDFNKDSDWDFFVIIDRDLDFNKRWEMILKIKRRLAKFEVPNDIIINSVKWVRKYQNDVGRITYYALKEGVEI